MINVWQVFHPFQFPTFKWPTVKSLLLALTISSWQTPAVAHSAPLDLQSLNGQWRLNPQRSDNATAVLTKAIGQSRQGLGVWQRKRAIAALEKYTTATAALTISCEPSRCSITGQGTPARLLFLDGRVQRFDSQSAEVVTQWKDNQLIMRGKTQNGALFAQVYTPLASGHLQVTMRIDSSQLPQAVLIRNVYDLVP
jgi:hypothetical protein